MITNRLGVTEVKVDQITLRTAMKLACKGGTKWSVRTSAAGIGDAFLANGTTKYARMEKDDTGRYAYIPVPKYETVCKIFGFNPENYCEEWHEYSHSQKATPEKKEPNDMAGVITKLIDIDRHITENTKAVEDLGYLIVEFVEQMKKADAMRKPVEKPKANTPTLTQPGFIMSTKK